MATRAADIILALETQSELDPFFVNAVTPLIRSSDLMGLSDPFSWFLSRRLGITHALSHGKALSRGSWFHAAFRCWGGRHSPVDTRARMETLLALRMGEISETCAQIGIDGDRLKGLLDREERDALTALAWFEASRHVPCISVGNPPKISWTEWLTLPHFQWLDIEPTLQYFDKVAQPDLIVWHKGQNSVWIVDLKTCSGSPLERLDTCQGEFQTHHYLDVLQSVLKSGNGWRHWSLPPDAWLGGFVHIAVSKPSIEFGDMDRDHTLDTTPLKTGPRKGQPRNERIYRGEPKLDNYLTRVREWFTSSGRYAHLAADRESDPPVNISVVGRGVTEVPHLRRIHMSRLDAIRRMVIQPARLSLFPAVRDIEYPYDRSPLFPLRNLPVGEWAEWLLEGGFSVRHRNDPAAAPVECSITPFEDPLP